MAAKKVGVLIKEARTNAGYSQAALAAKIDGLSATDISKAERGEKELTKEQLKAIAKATGVTQKSLLEAPFGKVTTTTTSSKKKTSSTTTASTSSSSTSTMKLTAAEKKLVEAYRLADSKTKKAALNVLKGSEQTASGLLESLLGSVGKKELGEGDDDEIQIYEVETEDTEA